MRLESGPSCRDNRVTASGQCPLVDCKCCCTPRKSVITAAALPCGRWESFSSAGHLDEARDKPFLTSTCVTDDSEGMPSNAAVVTLSYSESFLAATGVADLRCKLQLTFARLAAGQCKMQRAFARVARVSCKLQRVAASLAGVRCNLQRRSESLARVRCKLQRGSATVATMRCRLQRVSARLAKAGCILHWPTATLTKPRCNLQRRCVTRAMARGKVSGAFIALAAIRGESANNIKNAAAR